MTDQQIREAFFKEIQKGFPKVKDFNGLKRVPIKDLRFCLQYVDARLADPGNSLFNRDEWADTPIADRFRIVHLALKDVYKLAAITVLKDGTLKYGF